ncbi:hypothetical protein FACS1894166_06300 [Bacilli bacterium]|nr:hypothetical protein FACS1894166_06300 [Bacilli bacterium]
MDHYDLKQTRYSFIQALIIINRTHILRYAAQFTKQRYRASNHMTRICDEINVDRLPEFGFTDVEKINNILDRNEKIKIINQQLQNEPTKIKSIIGLRAKGYNNNEIAVRLNMTAKDVSNYFVIFVKRFRLLHPQLIDE